MAPMLWLPVLWELPFVRWLRLGGAHCRPLLFQSRCSEPPPLQSWFQSLDRRTARGAVLVAGLRAGTGTALGPVGGGDGQAAAAGLHAVTLAAPTAPVYHMYRM